MVHPLPVQLHDHDHSSARFSPRLRAVVTAFQQADRSGDRYEVMAAAAEVVTALLHEHYEQADRATKPVVAQFPMGA